MVTSSYPRFSGDGIATFMEPIATGVAARGHDVHLVAPWHPRWQRPSPDGGVTFHLYRYAPTRGLNVFGYAGALQADVRLRLSAIAVTPLAVASGVIRTRRVVRDVRPSIVHAHWVIPSGAMCALAGGTTPLVVSVHGSDVFVAERHAVARRAAAMAFRRAAWVTACSEDLRTRAIRLGADAARTSVVPYGVDSDRFRPDPVLRQQGRARLGLSDGTPLVLAFGRLVSKKGFEYLVDAAASLRASWPGLSVVIAGSGDLDVSLRARAAASGAGDVVRMIGEVAQHEIPALLAAADVAVAPSIRDDAGNVDGLPNTVLEIMASATPLVATAAGGIGAVAEDRVTARIVPERDAAALGAAIADLLRDAGARGVIGTRARALVCSRFAWTEVARQFDDIYARIAPAGR